MAKYREYKQVKRNYDEGRQMLEDPDPELREMATDEVRRLEPELVRIEDRAEGPAAAQGSARRQERGARNPRRHGRR